MVQKGGPEASERACSMLSDRLPSKTFQRQCFGLLSEWSVFAWLDSTSCRCYENGAGVQESSQRAVELYARAAELGHEEAFEALQRVKRSEWVAEQAAGEQ